MDDLPGGSDGKESACNAGDVGPIPGLGRSPGEGIGYPLWYPGLENSMDCTVHGVAESRTRLSDFHFPWRRPWQSTPVFLGFSGGSGGKESACDAGDMGLIHG